MMTKEELEKLITNGDRVYFINNKEIHSIGLDKNWCFIDGEYLKWSSAVNKLLGNEYYSINDLYKTKEEAEFALEFDNITRTETLKLPTWEEFNNSNDDFYFVVITDNDCSEYLLTKSRFANTLCLKVKCCEDEYGNIFVGKFDKENYIEACRVAKDLFLGKEQKE